MKLQGCIPMHGGTVISTSRDSTYVIHSAGWNFGNHSIPLLGSPSGLAHDGSTGVVIQLLDSDSVDIANWVPDGGFGSIGGAQELWLTGPTMTNGTGHLVCFDPDVPSSLELPYYQHVLTGEPVTVLPTFGGAGNIFINFKTGDADYGGVGIKFQGRSTDVDGDGDSDETDEALMRSAISAGTDMASDLNWSGTVTSADLDILLTEARRRVVGATCTDDGYDSGDGVPGSYDYGRNAEFPPAVTSNLSVSRIDASTVRLSWTASADDSSTGRDATGYSVRRSSSAISSTSAFNSATVVSSPPTPVSPGSTQTMDIGSRPVQVIISRSAPSTTWTTCRS